MSRIASNLKGWFKNVTNNCLKKKKKKKKKKKNRTGRPKKRSKKMEEFRGDMATVKKVFGSLLGLGLAYMIVAISLFVRNRDKQPIKARHFTIVMLSQFGLLIIFVSSSVTEIVSRSPCWIKQVWFCVLLALGNLYMLRFFLIYLFYFFLFKFI